MCYWAMSLMYSIQRFNDNDNDNNNDNDWAAEMEEKEHCRGGVRGGGNIRQGLRELKR